MKTELPEEITEALDILKKIEIGNDPEKIGEFFLEGIDSLNACIDDFPDYKNKIWNFKITYIKKLLKRLIEDVDLVDIYSIGYFLLLLMQLSEETKFIFKSDPVLHERFLELVNSYPKGEDIIKVFLKNLNLEK